MISIVWVSGMEHLLKNGTVCKKKKKTIASSMELVNNRPAMGKGFTKCTRKKQGVKVKKQSFACNYRCRSSLTHRNTIAITMYILIKN